MSFSMIIQRSTIAGAILVTAITANAGIDLTPSLKEYVSEGIKYQKLVFRDDKRSVEYYLPPGWRFGGDAHRVYLTPPKKNFAEAVIEAVTLEKPQPLDEKAVKAIEQQLIAEMPPNSQFAKVEQEIENSVPVNGGPSFEIVISYQAMGEKFLRSAIFANVRDTQLVFHISARKDDFEALHRDFKASIFSLHWVEPETAHSAVTQESEPAAAR
jgi:hypothetical protein